MGSTKPAVPRACSAAAAAVAAVVAVVGVLGAPGCSRPPPVPTRDPEPGSVIVVAAPPQERVAKGEARRGIGWYPDVEVDGQARVHVAWTDADLGDVMYAVSPANAVTPGEPEPVETAAAAGAFVRLALAPGDVPIISSFNQTQHTLRVAHRLSDVPLMKKAGADVDDTAPPANAYVPLAPGWVGEDIAFGDDAGAGSALAVDEQGRVHLAYGTAGTRMRYARRPASAPAFGAAGVGHWEKVDIDPKSGQSPALLNDLVVMDDGTVVVSFCDWQVAMAHLKLAVRPPSSPLFTVQPAREQPKPGIDGTSSALLERTDGKVDVAAVRLDDASVLVGTFDPKAPAPLEPRARVAHGRGPAVIKRGENGTVWILARDPHDKVQPGVSLTEVPHGDPLQSRRVLLEKGTADDPWLDLALRPDGRPVAVWFSEDAKGLKLYAP